MSFWLYVSIGLGIGAAPGLLASARLRAWWARRWWQTSLGLAIVLFVLPFGLVAILFLIDSAWEALAEMWEFLGSDFREPVGIALGWLGGSAALAWYHRKAPYLEGPPLSDEVKTLVRYPDSHGQALETYRKETGADMAVAVDVLEQFTRQPEGARKPQALGPLQWMYLGFAMPWYAILTVVYVLTYSSAGNPILAALGFFIFLPALFGGFCGVCGSAISAHARDALADGWERGALTRGYAFAAGAVAGLTSIAGIAAGIAVLYPLRHLEVSLLIGLVWVGSVLVAAPFLGLWLLRRRSLGTHDVPA